MKPRRTKDYLLSVAREQAGGLVFPIAFRPVVVSLGELGIRKAYYLFVLVIGFCNSATLELGYEVQGYTYKGDVVSSKTSPNEYKYSRGGYLYKKATEICWEISQQIKKVEDLRDISKEI